jgi:hypothetical protein
MTHKTCDKDFRFKILLFFSSIDKHIGFKKYETNTNQT